MLKEGVRVPLMTVVLAPVFSLPTIAAAKAQRVATFEMIRNRKIVVSTIALRTRLREKSYCSPTFKSASSK